ncbi:MAG TPA: GNAT family N-acetyltransferase [Pyrinomonadaceae bacterium]|nr:GNAT family N-acetyltransferase [Pyrinomonadaceae bacterium]
MRHQNQAIAITKESILGSSIINPIYAGLDVVKLTEADRAEVLDFLNIRPVHTVVMASFIHDNGIESGLNRGTFYGYHGDNGELEGVALLGHCTLIESRSDRAMAAFAQRAKIDRTRINLIMSEHEAALDFWQWYAGSAKPRLNFTELLFETSFPMLVQECEWDIRLARTEELEKVAEAHAEVVFIESGRDPMVNDREGFLQRVARRIEMGRTFVVFDGDKLIFKADIVAEADVIVYLEGIYVAPDLRGRGVGSRCLSKLNLVLLERSDRVCMLSNERFTGARKSFEKAGYRVTGRCTTLFV